MASLTVLFPSTGTKTLTEGSKFWCQCLAELYHKLPAVPLCNQFLGQDDIGHRAEDPFPRGSAQISSMKISEIWSFKI